MSIPKAFDYFGLWEEGAWGSTSSMHEPGRLICLKVILDMAQLAQEKQRKPSCIPEKIGERTKSQISASVHTFLP